MVKKMKTKEVKIAVDRGNGSTKIVCSVDGNPIEQFKLPSVVRKVEPNPSTVTIGKNSYLVGKEALVAKSGAAETPLLKRNKIPELSFVVAQAIHQVIGSSCTISLDVGVAAPLNSREAELEIKKELSNLNKGFKVGEAEYKLEGETIKRVKCESEAAGILSTNSNEFNAVIDVGFGTIITFFKDLDGSIRSGSFVDCESGGVNLSISELRDKPAFIEAMRKVKAPTLPSSEMIASVFAKGSFQFRGLDLLELIKPCIGSLVTRINAACEATKTTFLGRYSYDEDIEFKPCLIGGGAALIRAVIESGTEVTLHPELRIFEPTPDFQTALIIHQNLSTTPIVESVKKEPKPKKAKKDQSEETTDARGQEEEVTTGDQSSTEQVHSIPVGCDLAGVS
jgi:hypothetical protein